MQHCKRLSVILKLWNVVLRVRVISSSVGGGGGAVIDPHWPVYQNAKWEKYHVFSTSETVFCTGMD